MSDEHNPSEKKRKIDPASLPQNPDQQSHFPFLHLPTCLEFLCTNHLARLRCVSKTTCDLIQSAMTTTTGATVYFPALSHNNNPVLSHYSKNKLHRLIAIGFINDLSIKRWVSKFHLLHTLVVDLKEKIPFSQKLVSHIGSHLPCLQHLELIDVGFTVQELILLSRKCGDITTLILEPDVPSGWPYTIIESPNFGAVLRNLPKLRQLDLKRVDIRGHNFSDVRISPKLERIMFAGCYFGVDVDDFSQLARIAPNLTSFQCFSGDTFGDLDYVTISDKHLECFEEHDLKVLGVGSMGGVQLSDGCISRLGDPNSIFPNLRLLAISTCNKQRSDGMNMRCNDWMRQVLISARPDLMLKFFGCCQQYGGFRPWSADEE